MPAAITPINTPEKQGRFMEGLVVAVANTVYAGTLGALSVTGTVVPAADVAGLIVAGRVETLALKDTFIAGDLILIKRGTFKYNNSIINPIGIAQIGTLAFVENDNTVASTTVNKVKAGKVVGVDPDGVWIDTMVLAQAVPLTAVAVATPAAIDLATAQALANALKTAVNALIVDVAVIAAKLS
jgi:hypothetical protein